MIVDKLQGKNFRNLASFSITPGQRLNIVLGANGQGKTNLLEALYLFVSGKSFRAFRSNEMINWNKTSADVRVDLTKNQISHQLQMQLSDQGKVFLVDGLEKKRLADILGYLNAVLFVPDDLNLVKGSPSQRRQFIDWEIAQVTPTYYTLMQEYNKVVMHRNEMLKEYRISSLKATVFQVLNEKLIELGTSIVVRRLQVLHKLSLLARLTHRQLSGQTETLHLHYDSSLGFRVESLSYEPNIDEIQKSFAKTLADNKDHEFRRGVTLVGPHRDDIVFTVNNRDVRRFGSQGQQRTTVLALKLAELQFMKSETGEKPILLLDDVLSELDNKRQQFMLDAVSQNIQTFITATDIKQFPDSLREEATIFAVVAGEVKSLIGPRG